MTNGLPNWQERYNAKFILTIRVRVLDAPGKLAELLETVAEAGASVGDIRIAGADSTHKVRDVQLFLTDEPRRKAAIAAVEGLDFVELLRVTDEVLEIHRGGTIETRARVPLATVMDLRMVYTPGVASVCELIAHAPEAARTYTTIANRIAIVTNGTAVLGLGDIGPVAGMPVMEGKAAILAHFVGVSAEPVLLNSKNPDEIIDVVEHIAPGYGAIQLEDIAAPACFEIEERLQARLDRPVFHDDQHGTATVAVAGLINALEQTGRSPADCRGVILGAGAAGQAIARFLVDFGIRDLVVCDSKGAISLNRTKGMDEWKRRLAGFTNPDGVDGAIADVITDRNLFIGVSRPNSVTRAMIESMAPDSIVFALANPVSEIPVSEALAAGAAVAVDGRGMNNALAYPGIFRGALDAAATQITAAMKLAAARTLAACATDGLLPDMLDHAVHAQVSAAVAAAWNPADTRTEPSARVAART
ncbi:MAG: NAD-dependent malic enzyme [Phycisphaerales bacterium]|nr:NAD-dependent malic enzyme [Phycisphaerales bacterium]